MQLDLRHRYNSLRLCMFLQQNCDWITQIAKISVKTHVFSNDIEPELLDVFFAQSLKVSLKNAIAMSSESVVCIGPEHAET